MKEIVETVGYGTNVVVTLAALSNELATPKLLICPTESRKAATNFADVWRCPSCYCNYHAWYRSDGYGSPSSVLVSDWNLDPNIPSLYRAGLTPAIDQLRWMQNMHRYKGNFLFGDGHVALVKNGPELVAVVSSQAWGRPARPILVASPKYPSGTSATPSRKNYRNPSRSPEPASPVRDATVEAPQFGSGGKDGPQEPGFRQSAPAGPGTPAAVPGNSLAEEETLRAAVSPGQRQTNAAVQDVTLGEFDAEVVEILPKIMMKSYLFLWLLVLLYLSYKTYQWAKRRQQRSQR